MEVPGPEQRQAPRFNARIRVLYFSKGQPRAVDADCQNISAAGVFVKTRRRGPDTGTPVSMILNFEGSDKEIMMEGIVRWQGDVQSLDDGSEASGMGIQFTDMDAAIRDTLEEKLAGLPPEATHS
jgi:Tfp pilus assembly protein PilZ